MTAAQASSPRALELGPCGLTALAYVKAGWKVLPLHDAVRGRCSCRFGEGCTSPSKHPRTNHGVQDATLDPERVRQWWSKWPTANIGIATGEWFFVLDIDPRNGGDRALRLLEEKEGRLPATITVETGGRGKHFYFRSQPIPGTSKSRIGQGIDVKGAGGYVVAPPSIHVSGNRYIDRGGVAFEPASVVGAPDWLLRRLAEPRSSSKPSLVRLVSEESVRVGMRNDALTRLGGWLRHLGRSPSEIEVALLDENRSRCRPPLREDEVRKIARSVGKYDSAAEELRRIHLALDSFQWRGSGGCSDWAVMHAHLMVAAATGKLIHDASVRDLGLLTGLGGSAVSRAHARLCSAGWLEEMEAAGRRYFLAESWRLCVPEDVRTSLAHTNHDRSEENEDDLNQTSEELKCVSHLSSDVWRWKALGKCALRVWVLLRQHPALTAVEAAAAHGVVERTIRQHLSRLRRAGLAACEDSRWIALTPDMDLVARQLGVAGEGESQRAQVDSERRDFHSTLKDRHNVNTQTPIGRALAGFSNPKRKRTHPPGGEHP